MKNDNSTPNNEMDESHLCPSVRKKRRVLRNRQSDGESLRKKRLRDQEIERQFAELQTTNKSLKLRFNVGRESLLEKRRKKEEYKVELKKMLDRGASEVEVSHFINSYKTVYSQIEY